MECEITTEDQERDDAGTSSQDTTGVGATNRSESSSSELWATQMAPEDLARLLEDLPVELKFTRLQTCGSQLETQSHASGIAIKEGGSVVESKLVSTEGDIAENGLEDMRELVETHSTHISKP